MQSATNRPKVVAVASFGGHLVQLLRIMSPLAEKYDITYVSTSEKAQPAVAGFDFYKVEDYSRTNAWVLIRSVKYFRTLLRSIRPSVVVSTGAAPGLAAIIAARTLGIPTVFVDSIANAESLSMCGRVASHIAKVTLTQWPHLAKGGVKYHGTVL